MLQVKFIEGFSADDMTQKVNEALSEINSEDVTIIPIDKRSVVIQYETAAEYSKRLCSECRFWDDNGDTSSLSCFCTIKGKRMRYNCKACSEYKDIRS